MGAGSETLNPENARFVRVYEPPLRLKLHPDIAYAGGRRRGSPASQA